MPVNVFVDHQRLSLQRTLTAVLALSLMAVSAAALADDSVAAQIVVHDDRYYDLVDKGTAVEQLADEFGWAEGPVWAADIDALLFSDVAADTVYRWDETRGLSVFLTPSGHAADEPPGPWRGSNGLAIDAQGRLLLAQQSNRALARMTSALSDPLPSYESLVTEFEGHSINSPNDLVVRSTGDIYFTDPPYGLDGFENSSAIELDFFGVFRRAPDGQLSVVTQELTKPNGIALSPDQSTLLVSNSEAGEQRILAIKLNDDGAVVDSSIFFDATDLTMEGPGSTDGMAVHPSGNLFVSVPNGVAVLSPQGELLAEVALGQVTNLAIDDSASQLFITTPNRLLRMRLGSTR